MDLRTQLISVERDEADARCVLVNMKVYVEMRNGDDASRFASYNRLAGEKMFLWFSKRMPRSVFEGFMGAARRNEFAE